MTRSGGGLFEFLCVHCEYERSKNGEILTPEPTSVYLRYTWFELYRTSALAETSNREE